MGSGSSDPSRPLTPVEIGLRRRALVALAELPSAVAQDLCATFVGAGSDGPPRTVSAEELTSAAPTCGPPARRGAVTLDNVERVFTYQSPYPDQLEASARVRETFIAAARAILREVPDCADRASALRALREARLWANSAIALRGEV